MISYFNKLLKILPRRLVSAKDTTPSRSIPTLVTRIPPALIVGLALAGLETVPAAYYGRYLATFDRLSASLSLALSFLGTAATYLLLLELAGRYTWLKKPMIAVIAIWTALLQIVYFGIYREFGTLPTVSVVDFVRQTPEYAWALFVDRLNLLWISAGLIVVVLIARCLRWGFDHPLSPPRNVTAVMGLVVLASFSYGHAPFMSFGQYLARLVVESSHGPGVVNVAWDPDRANAFSEPAKYPVNVVVFRLEEIAALATTLERPELPTTPKLKALVDEHPNEAFRGHNHFSNSTATDVSVMSIYTGLSPAADLEAHRHIPILWDYFAAAGYNTSLFIPFHLEWGNFRGRFNARPGEVHLNRLMDAGNSGLPIVYDNSINDTDVLGAAIDYQTRRAWAGPFLQIISLKMPHAIGEGARVNRLSYGEWKGEPDDLKDYYNGIRHDDELIDRFMHTMPSAVKDKTIFVLLSDHGTRLFHRGDGGQDMHRLDNYHQETTKVPFIVYVPEQAQKILPPERIASLREALSTRTTSNIDLVPTLLGLTGIRPVDTKIKQASVLVGRDLSAPLPSAEVVVQLNSGPLRRWDKEHFALLMNNGRHHYFFSMGHEMLFDREADASEEHDVVLEPSLRDVVTKARTVTADVAELLRIQQKYRLSDGGAIERVAQAAQPARAAAPAAPAPNPNLVNVIVAPAGLVQLDSTPAAADEPVAAYTLLSAPASTTAIEFVVRVHEGQGRLEWQLGNGASIKHFAHVNQLSANEVSRFAFRWRPPTGEAGPLEIKLSAVADSNNFSFAVEKALALPDQTSVSHPIEVSALDVEAKAQPIATYHLDRFRQHRCLAETTAPDCPNGYLVWGPYVNAAKGSDVRLRYDIEVNRPGLNVWFDLSTQAGRNRIAQSRIYRLDESGIHSFVFAARLEANVDALEGRLNAFVGASLKDYAVTIENAELTLAVPPEQ